MRTKKCSTLTSDEIVALEPVRGKSSLVRVVLRDLGVIEIPLPVWADGGYRIGMQLNEEEIEVLSLQAEVAKARELALSSLDRKPRTVREMDGYLRKKGVTGQVREQVVQNLLDRNLLSDEQYAKLFSTARGKRMSRAELAWKLQQRGVGREVFEPVLNTDEALQAERLAAEQAGKKCWRRYRGEEPLQRRQKTAAYMQRHGFSTSVIRQVLSELERQSEDLLP